MEWNLIDTVPAGEAVLISCKLPSGKSYVIRGKYLPKFFEEDKSWEGWDSADDYDEERDCYFYPEGFYELVENWPEWSFIPIESGEPTHWMPIPISPTL